MQPSSLAVFRGLGSDARDAGKKPLSARFGFRRFWGCHEGLGLTALGLCWRRVRAKQPPRAAREGCQAALHASHLKEIQELLQPMISERRLDRARRVLQKRTQAVRLIFLRQKPADVLAALRTMDQFSLQFAEIIGELEDDLEKPGDTSGGSRNFVTVRQWPDLQSCTQSLRKALASTATPSEEKRESGEIKKAGHLCVCLRGGAVLSAEGLQTEASLASLKVCERRPPKLAVVFGEEGGVEEDRKNYDMQVSLPQRGFACGLSLNVTVAMVLVHLRCAGLLSGHSLSSWQRDLLWTQWLVELHGRESSMALLQERGLAWQVELLSELVKERPKDNELVPLML
ncbi:hypothetical protein AK812_SmicGene38687 [Symbiodinium microadriaticum]|uniref:tRNA/rRNA methyltransferase SpoU type domain-containing protein n=1 Tax=Symbiodinium microadriaticum TaxID=2951 RepID=A0A1Q9CD50_SYMMI|nr:hypothetical protein AK812_SmicGene38687 [Symbiodinium microadriaticum]CAE7737834.1 unnamed protein product [Symbiodinium sp. KB8]